MTAPDALGLILSLASPAQSEPRLGPADLPAYRAALKADASHAKAATYRDLWDRTDAFRGRAVVVEGVVARRFDQGMVSNFPAMTEVWIVDSAGNPTCLAHPTPPPGPAPARLDDRVRFAGVFLRKIRYPSGSGDRVAPLVVGGPPPTVIPPHPVGFGPARWTDGLVAAALLGLVALWWIGRRAARPPARPRPSDPGPPPEFVDGDDAEADDGGR